MTDSKGKSFGDPRGMDGCSARRLGNGVVLHTADKTTLMIANADGTETVTELVFGADMVADELGNLRGWLIPLDPFGWFVSYEPTMDNEGKKPVAPRTRIRYW